VFQDGSGRWPPCTPRRRLTADSAAQQSPQPDSYMYSPNWTTADTTQPHTTGTVLAVNRHRVVRAAWYEKTSVKPPDQHGTINSPRRSCGRNATRGRRRDHRSVLRSDKQPATAIKPVTPTLSVTLPVSFQAVSRPLELSLQSSLQLSFTVLVRYRSHHNI
jgi:hypothetical protein